MSAYIQGRVGKLLFLYICKYVSRFNWIWHYWETLTRSQVSNFDSVVLKIYCGSEIPVIIGKLDQGTSYVQSIYLTSWSSMLSIYIVRKGVAGEILLWSLEFGIHNKSREQHHWSLNFRLFCQLWYKLI